MRKIRNKEGYNELVREIQRHDRLYYTLDQPEISDREYDRLYQLLTETESAHPDWVRDDSPSQRIGSEPLEQFRKVRRDQAMLSLDNTYDKDEVKRFVERNRQGLGRYPSSWVVEPKIDGVSIEVTYRRGRLEIASTRGDGRMGEDVTANVRTIRDLPLRLENGPDELTVRGEIFIPKKSLELINRDRELAGDPLFKNCRNAAAGSLRLLDSRITAKRPLRMLIWGLVDGPKVAESHYASMQELEKWNLPISKAIQRVDSPEHLLDCLDRFEGARATVDYPEDGLVIKVNNYDEQEELGETTKYPRFAIAYKFSAERALTKIRDIRVQVGRTGTLTPVADFEPVELAGTLVSRASLHNEDEIQRKDIRVGDWVEIEKAGEIIPQVIRVLDERRKGRLKKFSMPDKCPSCGADVVQIDEAVAKRCKNRVDCPAQLRESLIYFASRSGMEIEHLGPALIDQLIEAKLVKDAADIYTLDQKSLMQLERVAAKSAQRVLGSIDQSRTQATLSRFITALGIPNVGRVAAEKLADYFGSVQGMIEASANLLKEDLESIDGIGPIIAAAVGQYLRDKRHQSLLKKFVCSGINPKQDSQNVNGKLSGNSFCITGKLSRPRSAFQKIIEAEGGQFDSTVKASTDFLVRGEGEQSNKDRLAEKHRTQIISEDQFNAMLESK